MMKETTAEAYSMEVMAYYLHCNIMEASYIKQRIEFLTKELSKRDFTKIEPNFNVKCVDLKQFHKEATDLYEDKIAPEYDDKFTVLYNMMIRLVHQNKRLNLEQSEN